MPNDYGEKQDLLSDLLLRWEELHEQGREISAAELCRDYPEHTRALAKRIYALMVISWIKDRVDEGDRRVQHPSRKVKVRSTVDAQTCRTLKGRYRLDERLGEGGVGEVWRGYDLELQRAVAIKLPKRSRLSSPGWASSFLMEARKAARLRHPNIVPIHDVQPEGGLYFIVADFIDGTDLAEKMRQARPSHAESARLVATVADALHHAHRQGLVHRDIKPSNILIDSAGKPYVTDFGSALTEEDDDKGAAVTPEYMSPEQARGEGHRVDGRSDIFSLGVVLYELLTGHRPFSAQTWLEFLKQLTTLEAPPLRQLDATIPKQLERICLKALSQRTSQRYATAKHFAEDLRSYLEHVEDSPGSPPTSPR